MICALLFVSTESSETDFSLAGVDFSCFSADLCVFTGFGTFVGVTVSTGVTASVGVIISVELTVSVDTGVSAVSCTFFSSVTSVVSAGSFFVGCSCSCGSDISVVSVFSGTGVAPSSTDSSAAVFSTSIFSSAKTLPGYRLSAAAAASIHLAFLKQNRFLLSFFIALSSFHHLY